MDTPRDPTQLVRPRRPFLLTLLFWIFILWSFLGWLRFLGAVMERSLILELLNPGYFWYFLLVGTLGGLAALPVLWGMIRRADWTPTLIWVISIFYPVCYWFERLFLWSDSTQADNWPFMFLLTFLWFGLVFWALRSPRGKQFFEKLKEE